MSSYSPDWKEIAYRIKSQANWCCQKCGQQCLRLKKDNLSLSRREKAVLTLQVHHWNRQPWDNREENLVALCSACHLSYHYLGHCNVTPGQLSLKLFQ